MGGIELDGEGAWIYRTRSCGTLPDTPLHQHLRWVIEQLHYNCATVDCDESGAPVTLTLGRGAPLVESPPLTLEAAKEHARRCDLGLSIAGVLAKAREEGVEPEHEGLSETARLGATAGAYARTEIYYALQLMDILARIRSSSFVFSCVPMKGRFPNRIVQLLGEATRAYLFGLTRSCVALCRTLMEDMLEERVPDHEVRQEKAMLHAQRSGPERRLVRPPGQIECLVSASRRLGILDAEHFKCADQIRKDGNDAVHGNAPSDETSWGVLTNVRRLAQHLCAKVA